MTATNQELRDFRLESVLPSDIDVGDRQRKDYGNLEDLADTIKKYGIAGPIALREKSPEYVGPYKFDLVCGGRRFAACLMAGQSPLPARIYTHKMDDHQLAVVENLENVYRKDFTVEELLASAARIHAAQVAIHGKREHAQQGGEGWSQAMTAEMLNMSTGKVSELLSLAAKAEKHPEIKSAKTMAEAKKISKTIDENKAKSKKARDHEAAAKAAEPAVVKLSLIDSFHIMDCVEGMKTLTPESFNIVEIDPPYAIDYKSTKTKGRTGGTTTLDYNEVEASGYLSLMDAVIAEAKRLSTPDSWLILWHAEDWASQLFKLLRKHGYSLRMRPAIWAKPETPGLTLQPDSFLARNYEQFFYAKLGHPKIHKPGRSDVFSFKGIPSQMRAHPTERPIELATEVLTTFAPPGSNVLVPFAGSGNTILAANNLNMKATGFDLSQQYKDTFIVKVYEGTPGAFASYRRKEAAK